MAKSSKKKNEYLWDVMSLESGGRQRRKSRICRKRDEDCAARIGDPVMIDRR